MQQSKPPSQYFLGNSVHEAFRVTLKNLCPFWKWIVLGIIQGLTEFLPISSTAHLVLIPQFLNWPDPGLSFDIALHVGTLIAVLIYFFRDWLQIIAQGLGGSFGADPGLRRNKMLLWLLILGTIPAGIAGLLFQKQAGLTTLRTPIIIGTSMIVIGILSCGGRTARAVSRRKWDTFRWVTPW